MGFSPSENEDSSSWRQVRAKIGSSEQALSQTAVIGERLPEDASGAGEQTKHYQGASSDPFSRPPRAGALRQPSMGLAQEEASTDSGPMDPEQQARLGALKRAAGRIHRVEKAAIDLSRAYRVGQRLFDPVVQRFGRVVYASEGYLRLELSDGGASAHGKPPLEDRRAFVCANFPRMDNREMAEILGISVHTMRRLCHEYGLRRHAKKKRAASAS